MSRMEASNTWCSNKAEWILEEEERGVVLQSPLRCTEYQCEFGGRRLRQQR